VTGQQLFDRYDYDPMYGEMCTEYNKAVEKIEGLLKLIRAFGRATGHLCGHCSRKCPAFDPSAYGGCEVLAIEHELRESGIEV